MNVFSAASRMTGIAAAGVLLMLAGCDRQRDPFGDMPQVNAALTSHFQKQAYAKTLRDRGVGRVAVRCTYNGEFRSSKGIMISVETKKEIGTNFDRDNCELGGDIVIEPTDSGTKVRSTHAYSAEVLDLQMSKVVALTNEMRPNEDLSKHMMAQPYVKVFKNRRIGAIDMVCNSRGMRLYEWEINFEFPYRTPYNQERGTCDFGAVVKIRPTFEGYVVSSNMPVSVEDFDKQMHVINESTQEQTSM